MDNRDGIGATGLKTKIIVNYIPQSMNDDEFRQLFGQCGALQECKIIRDKQTNYSFGYGFVDYLKPEYASLAISKLNGFQIQNKSIKVAYSKPPGCSKNANLYVTGLGKHTNEKSLEELFGVYGEIIQTKLLRGADGTSKEIGFVLFKEKPHADNAIKNLQGYSDGNGMNLQIKYAKDQNENQKQLPKFNGFYQTNMQRMSQSSLMAESYPYNVAPYSAGVMGRGMDYGGGYDSAMGIGKAIRGRGVGTRFNPLARPLNSDIGLEQYDPFTESIVLFVYNIGPNAQDSDLYGLFCRFGRINKVNVIAGKGYGFVHMPVLNEAQAAVNALNGMFYNGKNLQVSVKASK
ncbi:ELAV-like protein 3 [Hydra vulgaris]|uniref:ELAV-like protein 3 n=1 Tax=Hydra vulgaris TaxID=6087 RepID=A0ABM4BHD2_HYDVU